MEAMKLNSIVLRSHRSTTRKDQPRLLGRRHQDLDLILLHYEGELHLEKMNMGSTIRDSLTKAQSQI
jgi:hypothetical protein